MTEHHTPLVPPTPRLPETEPAAMVQTVAVLMSWGFMLTFCIGVLFCLLPRLGREYLVLIGTQLLLHGIYAVLLARRIFTGHWEATRLLAGLSLCYGAGGIYVAITRLPVRHFDAGWLCLLIVLIYALVCAATLVVLCLPAVRGLFPPDFEDDEEECAEIAHERLQAPPVENPAGAGEDGSGK